MKEVRRKTLGSPVEYLMKGYSKMPQVVVIKVDCLWQGIALH